MELNVRNAFVDFNHDATIDSNTLSDFQYVTKGGFALVFVANYRRSDGVTQHVAVKVLKPEHHFRRSNYSKFLQEVAFQTALSHPCIVRALGFCSVPASKLIGVLPPGILPTKGASGNRTVSAVEWFKERRLDKCWALVMELMADGNLFDQVNAAAMAAKGAPRAAASTGKRKNAAPAATAAAATAGALGAYSDAQALTWLIDLADAMTHLHSRQPLLIHRDLKPENILLWRDSQGVLHAKLSDFGLMVAVNSAGEKLPPPQILRAPGQSIADVCAAMPGFSPVEQRSNGSSPAAPVAAARGQPPGVAGPRPRQPAAGGGKPQSNLQPRTQVTMQMFPGWGAPGVEPKAGDGQAQRQAGGADADAGTALEAKQVEAPAQRLQPRQPPSPDPAQRTGQKDAHIDGTASAEFAPRPHRSAHSWTVARANDEGDAGGAGGAARAGLHVLQPAASLRSHAASTQSQPKPKPLQLQLTTATAAKGAAGGGTDSATPRSSGLLASPRSSPSRMSETGHAQVKMDQLNGLLRMGMGHKDYLPDMYQMTFKLTTQCGSVCYMAPEVARQLPYNQKADVFSFGCIMYELVTRQLLSDGIGDGDVDAAMEYLGRVSWSGWRPELPARLPKDIRLLISLSWHREPRLRPSFPTIAARLREALSSTAAPPTRSVGKPVVLQEQAQQAHSKGKEQARSQQQQQMQPAVRTLQAVQHQAQMQQMASSSVAGQAAAVGVAQQQQQQQLLQQQQVQQQLLMQYQQQQQQQQLAQHHQQQLQLQLQLQQLNACTRISGANGISPNTSTSTNYFNPPSPFAAYGGASRLPSVVASTCTAATHVTGGRVSSSVLGGQHVQGRSATSLEAALATAGRSTGTTLMGTRTSEAEYGGGLPSPGHGAHRTSGGQESSRGGLSKSDGSVGALSTAPPRSPRLAQGNGVAAQAGCMSLCSVM